MILTVPVPGQVVTLAGSDRSAVLLSVSIMATPGPPNRRGPFEATAVIMYQDGGGTDLVPADRLISLYRDAEVLKIEVVKP
jgi:hypothetical protein